MSTTEIILVLIGLVTVVVGYIMPAGLTQIDGEAEAERARKNVERTVRRSLENARSVIRDQIDDSLEETMLKSERSMERITNDRIDAISDYADSVLSDIHKNHDEVMFMYEMLSDKHKTLTTLASDVSKSAKEAEQTVRDAELTAKETMESARSAMEDVMAAKTELELALAKSREASGASPEAHAEGALSGMQRINENWFAPFAKEIPRVDPDMNEIRVLGTDEKTEREAVSAQAADFVANALSSKVVPIMEALERHDAKTRTEETPVTGGSLAYATQTVPVQDRQALILEMHTLGKSNVAIARELGVGVGEVKLVLDLFGKGRKQRKA